jgi:O-methyltransferase
VKTSSYLDRALGRLREKKKSAGYSAIYEKFRDYTMIPRSHFIANLELAARCKHLPGCVVECGVWRGGMIAGMASILGPQRQYVLFDSFQGLPPAKSIDGAAAISWQEDTTSPEYRENCAAPRSYSESAMKLAGAASVRIVEGWFNKTIPKFEPDEPIAVLRLDADWYESTMVCLTHLFDKVVQNGLIIIDDYHTWDGCSRAVHKYLSMTSATERISEYERLCYMVKRGQAN